MGREGKHMIQPRGSHHSVVVSPFSQVRASPGIAEMKVNAAALFEM